MSEQALNDVFRPSQLKRRAKAKRAPRTGFRAYAVRRLRQMVLSWMVMAGLGIGANMVFQSYAQEKYGIGLEEQLAALDEISGGVLGLSALAGGDPVQSSVPTDAAALPSRPMTSSERQPSALPGAAQSVREITDAGALLVRVPQSGD
ncbi:hypothetical protein FIU97_01485 [Roseivivax sp. THAF40]|uniref:hypothetical protein n=1 Tax=unclassified Roseivivax TaxID=2639302 RepID=UPI001268C4F8|nr:MULTISPECIES: hypothetical protein [unclassified Roseivivax]QFS81506.1 hypothetical protein FIV09_01575 [Roseivivax sp. THAF197b]QFT45235.1 hypothetical protein FIU97_01485 [Roseivivax sp. THAF40]